MRRSRRGGHLGADFPSSGEDSFVAVVVTKLTGALLFILLLTMVIMALLPRAIDIENSSRAQGDEPPTVPLAVTTPAKLPEAIVGRPYTLALAANGGKAPLKWHIEGPLPPGLEFNSKTGLLEGTPTKATPAPVELLVHVTDGSSQDSSLTQLTIYQPATPLSLPSTWKPSLPPIPLDDWLQHGFGFLLLILVHLVGMSTLTNLERRLETPIKPEHPTAAQPEALKRRMKLYRMGLRLATLAALAALALWIARPPAPLLP